MHVLKRCAYPTCVNIESHHYKLLSCEGCVNNSKLAQAARYCSHKCQGNLGNIVRLNIENYKDVHKGSVRIEGYYIEIRYIS